MVHRENNSSQDLETKHEDFFKKSKEFLQFFTKTKEFMEELLKENERLRYRIATLESQKSGPSHERLVKEIEYLKKRIEELEYEKKALEQRYREVEEENRDFALRYAEIEEQNNNLANLYVASYQLHSTLDFEEVLRVVQEIVINLIAAETFGIFLLDEVDNVLHLVAHEGMEEHEGMQIRLGEGIIGEVARTGEPFYINQSIEYKETFDVEHPLAVIPLKIKERVIGVISIFKLFVQKDGFSALDHELFTLLAGHAATAIFSAKLYTQTERKLSTYQSFLELLVSPPQSGES